MQLGVPNTDESTYIKGVFDCSETDSMGYLQYCFVQIEPLGDVDEYDLTHNDVRMCGDREWYNTKDTFESYDGIIKFKLDSKGNVVIVDKKKI